MSNFNYTDDAATVERMSEQRDAIYEYVVDMFRHHMANDDICLLYTSPSPRD